MLIPDVLAPAVIEALRDMGADLSKGTNNIAQGVFREKLVIFTKSGSFVEIICKHDATYQQIKQIVSMLFSSEGLTSNTE